MMPITQKPTRLRALSLQATTVLNKMSPAVASLCASLLFNSGASADVQRVKFLESGTDGVYGRFDGDITWSLRTAVGVNTNSGKIHWGPGVGLDYLSTMGLYIGGTSPSIGTRSQSSSPQGNPLTKQPPLDVWLLSTGIELRPLFLPRWVLNLEQGPAWLDLTLDSLTFFGGVVFPLSEESVSSEFGVGLSTPISGHFRRPEVDGFWLDLKFLRQARAGSLPSQSTVWLGFSWRTIQSSGLLSGSAN